jgi:hypothetical protein
VVCYLPNTPAGLDLRNQGANQPISGSAGTTAGFGARPNFGRRQDRLESRIRTFPRMQSRSVCTADDSRGIRLCWKQLRLGYRQSWQRNRA